ncbi:hypothetical protein MYBA111488_24370 [Mycobacterium basiliense]
MSRATEHAVIRQFSVLTGGAGLLIPTNQKNDVVRRRRNRQRHQNIDGEGRQVHEVIDGKHTNDAAHQRQFGADRQQRQENGRKRAVRNQQHERDHRDADPGDFLQTAVAEYDSIGAEGAGTRYVGLETRRWRHALHDPLHRGNGIVRLPTALIASEVKLGIRGLAVNALRARRGQPVAPKIVDVLDMSRVPRQPGNQGVVIPVRLITERGLTL